MTKRTITAVAAITLMTATVFSQTQEKNKTDKFLDRYEALVNRVQEKYFDNTDSIACWKKERATIKQEYKSTYESLLNDDQQTRYASLTAQYQRRTMKLKVSDARETLDTVGVNIDRTVKRTTNKVKGWLKGFKK